ncbi:MAG: hypothetical protein IT582_08730, partial [Opitutaceae bacterium]|nr:hypothetical protein [Opitutaceae bacterium]
DAAEQSEETAASAVVLLVRTSAQAAAGSETLAPLAVSPVPAGDLAAATGLEALATVREIPTL